MRCLVTGATGFVGSHLVERLRAEGHEVAALSRSSRNRADLERAGVRAVEGSLDSRTVFAAEASRIDTVFHLAAITKAVRAAEFTRINADGCSTIAAGLSEGGFRGRVVYLGSLAAGGPAVDGTRLRSEADPDAPVSEYGRSKGEGERRFESAARPGGWQVITLRAGAIYGPREHEILEILKLIAQAGIAVRFGGGVRLQMTHVADVVDGLMRAMYAPQIARPYYYLSDEQVWTFDQIVTLAAKGLGRGVRIIPAPVGLAAVLANVFDLAGMVAGKALSPLNRDKVNELRQPAWLCTSAAATAELGWKSTVPFDRGIAESIAWYRANGML